MKKWHYLALALLGLTVMVFATPQGRRIAMSIYNTLTGAGLNLLKQFEGYSRKVYQDVSGYWTIGYGHLVIPGDRYHPYGPVMQISDEEADALLRQDTEKAQSAIRDLVTVPLSENQFDALTSLAYNIGRTNFANSPVRAALNAGDYAQAADAFRQHKYSKGKVIPGLITRREHERGIFLS